MLANWSYLLKNYGVGFVCLECDSLDHLYVLSFPFVYWF